MYYLNTTGFINPVNCSELLRKQFEYDIITNKQFFFYNVLLFAMIFFVFNSFYFNSEKRDYRMLILIILSAVGMIINTLLIFKIT